MKVLLIRKPLTCCYVRNHLLLLTSSPKATGASLLYENDGMSKITVYNIKLPPTHAVYAVKRIQAWGF